MRRYSNDTVRSPATVRPIPIIVRPAGMVQCSSTLLCPSVVSQSPASHDNELISAALSSSPANAVPSYATARPMPAGDASITGPMMLATVKDQVRGRVSICRDRKPLLAIFILSPIKVSFRLSYYRLRQPHDRVCGWISRPTAGIVCHLSDPARPPSKKYPGLD